MKTMKAWGWLALGALLAPLAPAAADIGEAAGDEARVDRLVITPSGDHLGYTLVSRPGDPPITLVIPVFPAGWPHAGGYGVPRPPLAPPAPAAPAWSLPYRPDFTDRPYLLYPGDRGFAEREGEWRHPGVRYERHAGGTVLRSRPHPGGRVDMRPGETIIRSRVQPGERVARDAGGMSIRSRPRGD